MRALNGMRLSNIWCTKEVILSSDNLIRSLLSFFLQLDLLCKLAERNTLPISTRRNNGERDLDEKFLARVRKRSFSFEIIILLCWCAGDHLTESTAPNPRIPFSCFKIDFQIHYKEILFN